MTTAERWGADLRSLLRICYARTAAQILEIWRTVDPLEKDRARAAMEAAFRSTMKILRFLHPHIPHAVVVMVMALAFHTKDVDRVEDTINIFLFTDLSPLAGLEAALLTRKWGAILGEGPQLPLKTQVCCWVSRCFPPSQAGTK